jgi:hypothetical protein
MGEFDFSDYSVDPADYGGIANLDMQGFDLSALLGDASDYGSLPNFDADSFNLSDFGNLLTPGGVDESGISSLADYGEGWVRNLTDESQDYATDNGVVKYYDDGRVETFGNDGRYVNYTDGNVVDYSNINDQTAPVETWNKDGRYVNYANNNVVDYSNIKDQKAPVITSNADGTKTIYKDDKVFVQGKDGTITEITKIIDNTQKGGGPGGVKTDKKSGMDPSMMLMLMALLSQMNKGGGGGSSQASTIPALTANRSALPYSAPPRPGAGGKTYFSPTTYAPRMANGGEVVMASGGISSLGGYSDGGQLLKGPGDGVSDSIPATIGKRQPARLADGEFVVPARIVSELGNGSTEAGARKLYAMMKRIEKTRKGAKNIASNTKSDRHLPA